MRGALWEELGQLEKSVQWLGTSNPHLPMQLLGWSALVIHMVLINPFNSPGLPVQSSRKGLDGFLFRQHRVGRGSNSWLTVSPSRATLSHVNHSEYSQAKDTDFPQHDSRLFILSSERTCPMPWSQQVGICFLGGIQIEEPWSLIFPAKEHTEQDFLH